MKNKETGNIFIVLGMFLLFVPILTFIVMGLIYIFLSINWTTELLIGLSATFYIIISVSCLAIGVILNRNE